MTGEQIVESMLGDDFDPKEYVRDLPPDPTFDDLDEFTTAYLVAALWSTNDEADPETGGEPLDQNFTIRDLDIASLRRSVEDCRRFQEENAKLLSVGEPERAGHDFWLTRNHHGAGFWDGDWPKIVGKMLTDAAHEYGEVYVEVYQPEGTEHPDDRKLSFR